MTLAVRRLLVCAFLVLAVATLGAPSTFAQGGATSSLSGTVTDTSGAVVPGASVTVKNMATNTATEAVTNAEGQFTAPALNAGKYAVVVTLSGFKTATVNDIDVRAGVPAGVSVKMEVGGVEEQVVVTGGSEIVATQSSTVATTISSKQIQSLPLTSRNALDFVVNLPGVNTPGTARNSTVNGLPQGSINMTLDGVSIQDNYLKTSDGFFARVQPRLDAIEEVTVTSAANGADSGGQGAVNIRFVTKSGTNTYKGNVFHTYQNDLLNTNTFFNNRNLAADPVTGKAPKADLLINQPGFNAGGPITIPGLFDGHNKAFFFFNYEDSRSPSKITRTRTILTEGAAQGLYAYSTSSGTQTLNLLQLAAANGQTASLDPTISKLLGDIRSASGQGQIVALSDPSLQSASFQVGSNNFTPYPLGRIDYNISRHHTLTGSFNYNHVNSTPDTTNSREPFFPGFPNTGSQQSTRYTTSETLRSMFGSSIVNEFHVGASGGATKFSPELSASLFGGTPVADQGGFYLNLGNGCCATALTNAGGSGAFSAREGATRLFEDTLNLLEGKHSMSVGGGLTKGLVWLESHQVVPELRFGVATGDPAAAFFNNTANFPGASTAQITQARNLYAMLTGRVSQMLGNARLIEDTGKYEYLGDGFQRGEIKQWGFFAQDNWRIRNNLTINAGLRYELALPFESVNSSYSTATFADVCGISGVGANGQCNLFMPGTLTGKHPTYINYSKGTPAFKTDRNNFAPSLGMTYRPSFDHGLLRRLVGQDGDTVLFASYAMSFERQDMSQYTGAFGTNPGVSIAVNKNTTTTVPGSTLTTLNGDGLGLPLLFRDRARLAPPPFASSPVYPLVPQVTDALDIYNQDMQTPYAQSWAGGIRRKVSKDIGVEVRYVGTRHLQGWAQYDLNEANIVENGFVKEFRQAQANLQANIQAGRGNTFAFTGAPGTAPLPIYLAYFTGTPLAQAGDSTKYTGTSWTDTNFTNPLAVYQPVPFTPAGTSSTTGLDGDPTRRANAAAAGLPANFFRLNPDVLGGALLESNSGYTKYDSLQMDVTKRLSHGLLMQGSYVFGNAYISNRYSLKRPRLSSIQTGDPGSITHALKFNWVYELPFGNGRHFGNAASGWLDRVIGGWELDGISRIQSGRMLDLGNIRVVGMSTKDVQKAFKLQEYAATGISSTAPVNIYMFPQDIMENTIRAFSTSATTATGYGSLGAPTGRYFAPANGPDCLETAGSGFGDCGVRTLVVTGPTYKRVDLSAVKRTRVVGHTMFEFRADLINAFNHANFVPVVSTSTNADNWRVTAVQENSNRTIQLVMRFSW
jgi:Carboxypeptidase regulatory-like domain/TonB dependent receptor/TonB-dependent Receptor Plug Domain